MKTDILTNIAILLGLVGVVISFFSFVKKLGLQIRENQKREVEFQKSVVEFQKRIKESQKQSELLKSIIIMNSLEKYELECKKILEKEILKSFEQVSLEERIDFLDKLKQISSLDDKLCLTEKNITEATE